MRFHTTILQGDKTATGIRIPDEVVEALGAGKRPPITVTINGFTYRSTVAVMGGAVHGRCQRRESGRRRCRRRRRGRRRHRARHGPAGGGRAAPTSPQALDAEPAARRTFDGLSNSNKGWHVYQIEGAKTDETRQRRIGKSIDALREGRVR